MNGKQRVFLGLVVATGLMSGCSDHEFAPPDRAARVERANASYSPAAFDTISWASDEVRLTEGNEVYASACRRCHGVLGGGATDYARVRGLEVPSLVEVGWPLADLDSIRRRVFSGHAAGMPVFGDGTLGLREIDASAAYVLYTLRPEVLQVDYRELVIVR